MIKRAFTAAHAALRCSATVNLSDGSSAQCMRASRRDGLCFQHHAIAATMARERELEQIHSASLREHMVGEDGECVGWCQMCIKEKQS